METITKRGDYQFQAIIRRKGYPSQTKTFETKAEAERWAREVEATMDTGYYRDRREVERTTLGQALEKYLELISPGKRGYVAEKNRIKQLQKARLGRITKAGDAYLRSLLVMGARAVLAGLGDKQDRFSRWARNLVERRGYWKAAVAIAAKNLRLAWAVLHYGDDFRRIDFRRIEETA